MLEQSFDFTGCSTIQFFNSPPFSNPVSYAALVTLKKYVSKITLSKKLILGKTHFQNCSLKNCISKKYIFKIVFSKNSNFKSLIYSSTESSESSEVLSKSLIICLTTFL